jgi:mannosyltransferase OCH1-like enzyme
MLIPFLIFLFLLIEFLIYFRTTAKYKYEDNLTYATLSREKGSSFFVEEEEEIPKKIIQTYSKKEKVPDFVRDNIISLNEGWEYNFYDDEMAKEFLEKEFSSSVREKFDSFKRGAHKADLFRLCWLYKNGGVYIDIDTEILVPLDKIISSLDQKLSIPITEASYGRKRLLNCFIIANKGNPILGECIENVMKIKTEELDNCYHLILHTMQETIGDRIIYKMKEKNDSASYIKMIEGNNWKIYDDKGKWIADSRYSNFDRWKGFI